MSGFGGFTPEAYQQLQEAYSQQLSQADEVENAGVKIGNDTLGVETVPFRADWLDKTGLWKYPDGRGDYVDARQTQENLLAALQTIEEEVEEDEDIDFENLTDEELLETLDTILNSDEEDEDEEELLEILDTILNSDEEDEDDEEYGNPDLLDVEEISDEELDALIDELTSDFDSESEKDDLDLDELEAFVGEILGESEVEESYDDDDAISISDKIAALKEELAVLSAGNDEEPTEIEPEGDEDPVEEKQEVTSYDEFA